MTSFTIKEKAADPDSGFHTFAIKCYMKHYGRIGGEIKPSKLIIESRDGDYKLVKGEKRCQEFFSREEDTGFSSHDGSVKLEISWAEAEGGEPSLDQINAGLKPGYYQIIVNGTPFDDLEFMPADAAPPFTI